MSGNSTLTLWQKATEDYKQRLTKNELEAISKVQHQDSLITQIKSSSPTVYQASRLESIQSGLNRYAQFLAVFAFPVPEVANLLWGSIELIRKKSTIAKEVESMIAGMLEQLCILAPRLRTYEKIFEYMEGVEFAMISLYRSILEFFVEANAYIKRCSFWTSKIGARPEPIRMRQALEDMKKFKTLVESEAWTANVDLHYKWHEEIREILSNVKIQPKDSIVCHIIPYPTNSRFVGRTDTLQLLKRNLAISKNNQSSFALHGMGGVGKTQIALKYIYDNLDHFPVIFWMNADSTAKLTQSFVEAAKRINIEAEDSHSDAEAVAQMLKTWLRGCKEEWLIVFDNADDLNILKPFWPPGNHGTIILTSRDPSAAQVAKRGTLVKPLQPEEGVNLFLSLITPPDTEHDDNYTEDSERIKDIVKLLGYLPLAIDQVAHFILEKDCTVEDFHEIYKASMQSKDTFAQIGTTTSNLFYEHSLATVWRISIKTLGQNSNTLLSILACLDPDGIPETLLREGSRNNPDLKFLAETVSYFEATSELQRNGLVTKTSTQVRMTGTTQNRHPIRALSVHRLVQETVFHQQSAKDQNATFSRAVTLCLRAFPHPTKTNFRLMHQWTECECYLPHLLALNNRFLDCPALDLGNDIAELFLYGSWYLYERRLPELALPLLKTACGIIEEKENAVDWFFKSRIEQCLGCVLFECSRFTESEAAFRKALAIRLANVSPNDILLAHGYQDTALPVTAQRRYNEALELQRKALVVIEQNTDDFTRRDMTFHVHHNMGRTLEAAGGVERVQEALALHFHQGDPFGNGLRQEISESGAINLYAIGNCYLALGEEEGVDYHTRALKIRKQLVGDQGFYYGISLHRMGRILFDKGSFSEAQDAFERARSIFENALDSGRELARTLWYLSTVKRELGEEIDSEQLANRAWKLRSKLTGEVEQDMKHDCKGFDELVIYIHA